jgi:hypothetical protein
MKHKLVWFLVLLLTVAALQLPGRIAAQGGGTDAEPDAGDTLAPYRDWLWGALAQGLRVTGGSECAEVDGAQRCSFDFTLTWAE